MAIPVLILGKSGSGKSTSIRNLKNALVVNVANKPLPFKGKDETVAVYSTDDYAKVESALLKASEKGYRTAVIDDAGYLITNAFMRNHSTSGKGNQIFDLYNQIGDDFWGLLYFISSELPKEMIVYVIMHEDKNEFGETKPKTIGKLLDDKVCIEGMFTIVLHAMKANGKYVFATNSDGLDCAKSPLGMFDEESIDNDLAKIDEKIREYYEL